MSTNSPAARVLAPIKLRTQVAAGFRVDEFDLAHPGTSWAAPFEMSLFCIEAGSESVPESHEDAELWLVAAGVGLMSHGEQVLELRPGCVVSIEPGIVHKVMNTGSTALQVFSVWWSGNTHSCEAGGTLEVAQQITNP